MENLTKYETVIRTSPLFAKLPPDAFPHIYTCLHARCITVSRGTEIAAMGGEKYQAGLILHGELLEFTLDEDGNQTVFRRLLPGQLLGAELACTGRTTSPFFQKAVKKSVLLLMNFEILQWEDTLKCPYRVQLTANLMQIFAEETLRLSFRIQIVSQKTLREKIRIYLQEQSVSENGCIYLPLNRRELANFLNADRSALCRELGKLRDEKILQFSGNEIHLLANSFLE